MTVGAPLLAKNGLLGAAWIPLEEAEGIANFPMITGLRCVSGPRWLSDFGTLKLHSETDVAALRASGLIRGGSLSNAVVIGDQGVVKPRGISVRNLRHPRLAEIDKLDPPDRM